VRVAWAAAALSYVADSRRHGRPYASVGAAHPVFATEYQPTWVDVVVLVAPVTGDSRVTSLVGVYASVGDHRGLAALVPAVGGAGQVRGFVPATSVSGRLTVVVAGPGAVEPAVDFHGSTERPEQVPGGESLADSSGTAWLYPAVAG
jgi:hypothetical protein